MNPRNASGGRWRATTRPWGWAVGLALLLAIIPAGLAESGAGDPEPTVARQVLSELRAANVARTQLLDEQQQWAMENEQLELLAAAVRAETRRFAEDAQKAEGDAASLQQQAADLRAQQNTFDQAEAMVDTLAERLEQALETVAGESLPGVVPPDRSADITEPSRRLAAAAARLRDVERNTRESAVEIVAGDLGGRSATVKLLRLGGVAAWWVSLDGTEGGTAVLEGGTLVLQRGRTDAETAAVRKAFAIVQGQVAPTWVLLPMDQIRGEK